MTELNRQHILKAFFQFDKRHLPVPDGKGGYMANMDVATRKRLCEEWLTAFCTVDGETFEHAIELALGECKKYPDQAAMWNYINQAAGVEDEAPAEIVWEQEEQKPVAPQPASKIPGYLSNSQRIAKMMELAKQGDFKAAASCLAGKDVITQDEIICYAKEHWQDASFEWIAANGYEIKQLVRQEKACAKCMTLKGCKWRGYQSVGEIDKFTGALCIKVQACSLRRMEQKQ